MADEADRGNDQAQQMLDLQLRVRKPTGPKPCGACHYCSETVPAGHLFCDGECAADYQYEQDARRRNGQQT